MQLCLQEVGKIPCYFLYLTTWVLVNLESVDMPVCKRGGQGFLQGITVACKLSIFVS